MNKEEIACYVVAVLSLAFAAICFIDQFQIKEKTKQEMSMVVDKIENAKTELAEKRGLKEGDVIAFEELGVTLPEGFHYDKAIEAIRCPPPLNETAIKVGEVGSPVTFLMWWSDRGLWVPPDKIGIF